MTKISTRPILFSGFMVRAIMDGTKTQTRRVIKPAALEKSTLEYGDCTKGLKSPYGRPGDRLWVRETWALLCDEWPCECETDEHHHYEYKADSGDPYPGQWPVEEARGNLIAPKWRPSIFMPREASRLTLEVLETRIERIQDITYEDAVSEGIEHEYPRAWAQFRDLWDFFNAKRGFSWESNPWVWVVKFQKIET